MRRPCLRVTLSEKCMVLKLVRCVNGTRLVALPDFSYVSMVENGRALGSLPIFQFDGGSCLPLENTMRRQR